MAAIFRATHDRILETPTSQAPATLWLIRIPEVFLEFEPAILLTLQAKSIKKLGRDFRLIQCENPDALELSDAAKFIAWKLPVHHSWPCCPQDTPGFIEKATQALARKFGESALQALLVGALDPGSSNRYYRTLASNLRGRALQLFPQNLGEIRDAEGQDSRKSTLFCLIGKEGLFCGVSQPLAAKGFYPAGTKFIRQNSPETISRAGAKIAEALHHLRLHRAPPAEGSHWLELGASPGGMTAELLGRKYRVTAVDRAPLDPRLKNATGLRAVLGDVSLFDPPKNDSFDAILCDMNGDPHQAMAQVIRLSSRLKPAGLVIFTLKTTGATSFSDINDLEKSIITAAGRANLTAFARTHLTYNRQEFTLFFNRVEIKGDP